MKKMVIVFAAGGAAGKTTTRKAFTQGEPEQFSEDRIVLSQKGEVVKKVYWTLYDNCGAAGNHYSGADINNGPFVVREALYECLAVRDISIVEGMLLSPQWPIMIKDWVESYPEVQVRVLIVYMKLTADDLMDRLETRRGIPKEEFPRREEMYKRCNQLVRRAELLIEHFENLSSPDQDIEVIEIYADDDTNTIVQLMDEAVCDYFEDCE
jgi:hypothetical protein